MILVSGGAGVMGSRLVKGLVEAGNKVRVLTIPNDPYVSRLDGVDCEIFYGDVSDASSLKGAFDDVKTVYHLAAVLIAHDPTIFEKVNVNGTRNMVEDASSAGVEHFIFVSSASVVYPYTTPYSESKRQCERIVKEQKAMHYTIVRPTLSYNESGGQEFFLFRDYLMKYPIVLFIGRGKALKSPVHVDDLFKGFLAIPGNEKTFGKIYAFSGGEEISIWDFAKLTLKHMKTQKLFIPVPVPVCKILAEIMKIFMKRPSLTWNVIAGITQDANLDHVSASEDLGYHPIPVCEGFQKCFPL